MIQVNLRDEDDHRLVGPTVLRVFDFDSTLFRSPDKPAGHRGGWAWELVSLSPPHVPEDPGPEMWNWSVVSDALSSQSDPDAITVMITGRPERLRGRIEEILGSAGLTGFDSVHMLDGGETGEFKIRTISRLLDSNPSVQSVEIWDDREDLMARYADWLSLERGIVPTLHHV